jgi:hypothetical protein
LQSIHNSGWSDWTLDWIRKLAGDNWMANAIGDSNSPRTFVSSGLRRRSPVSSEVRQEIVPLLLQISKRNSRLENGDRGTACSSSPEFDILRLYFYDSDKSYSDHILRSCKSLKISADRWCEIWKEGHRVVPPWGFACRVSMTFLFWRWPSRHSCDLWLLLDREIWAH